MKKNKNKMKPASPTLRFGPTAWAKLLYLRDRGDTEVGGFGIAAEGDLLYVEDFVLVKQTCTPVSVSFEDESVANYFDSQADRGRPPERCARIWIHTHPGRSPAPSTTDEESAPHVSGLTS
jgi:proteasome lid subunit RPN8/RPN11